MSAGDSLEAIMAAHGSGAVAFSAEGPRTILNVDMGGGTVKFAICRDGRILETAAINIGARLVVVDGEERVIAVEEAGQRLAERLGLKLKIGDPVGSEEMKALAVHMVEQLLPVIRLESLPPSTRELLRTPPMDYQGDVHGIVFSGGVSEFIYDREGHSFGDLGPLLATQLRERLPEATQVLKPVAGIRATVIGASQYTVQVSGSTIYISSLNAVPVRNMPVIRPQLPLDDEIDSNAVAGAIEGALRRFDLNQTDNPVAIMVEWTGSATFHRLNSLCRGIVDGLSEVLRRDHPVVLVSDGDIGGLLGIHIKEEVKVPQPVISIDGIQLNEFDFVDIGNFIPSSGAVPVI
ncbi:MAG: ethanolamine utilization protein EutA, partial [Deltaproteobacteria bacterium]|nr:ethanolamine utilization protein EutA [Deltaproteobacteria bacterium]